MELDLQQRESEIVIEKEHIVKRDQLTLRIKESSVQEMENSFVNVKETTLIKMSSKELQN